MLDVDASERRVVFCIRLNAAQTFTFGGFIVLPNVAYGFRLF